MIAMLIGAAQQTDSPHHERYAGNPPQKHKSSSEHSIVNG
jgi:hypothetical protein